MGADSSTADLDRLYTELSNWGRWGDDDQRGALNHLQPEHRTRAAGLVRDGHTISLARNLATTPSPENPYPAHHHMLAAGDARDSNGIAGYEAARDYVGSDVHGLGVTHVDALSHMFVRGEMYGGRPASEVRSDGALSNTVMSMVDGVVGRGVLLDIPRVRGAEFLENDDPIRRADLEAAAVAANVEVSRGDVLLVAWGRDRRRRVRRGAFDGMAGLHPDCLAWLHGQEIAVLGSDGISDPMPGLGIDNWPFPIHQIGITAIGLHLIDNLALDALAERCAAAGRWEFLFSMAPLRIERATGCPVNPVAVLLSATDELRALMQRYARAADERDIDGLTALFHPDATIDGARGPLALDAWLDTMRAPRTFPTSMHVLGDPLIELDGDGAGRLDTYAVVYQLGDTKAGQGDLTMGVQYTDSVVFLDGRWVIRDRVAWTIWLR